MCIQLYTGIRRLCGDSSTLLVLKHTGAMEITEQSQFEGLYDVLCDDVIRTKVTMKEILEA